MNRELPALARYLLAEGLTADATSADPRGYALAAARSEGWPAWLRGLVARPLALAAASGRRVDREALAELAKNDDPFVAAWAEFALHQTRSQPLSENEARIPSKGRSPFAARLLAADGLTQPALGEALDHATLWVRDHQPSAREVWAGWRETSSGIARDAAPDLPEK